MDRRGIRELAAEKLKLPTSPYRFAASLEELEAGAAAVGFPCFIKPTMSSSGHGQSVAKKPSDLKKCWDYAIEGSRANTGLVIVEGAIDFDYEITQLTVRRKQPSRRRAPSPAKSSIICVERMAAASLASSSLSKATWCGSPSSLPARMIPAW
jgi:formate-dependent phosphoribosylglycinamide formyltransferase (GAR transformylase)